MPESAIPRGYILCFDFGLRRIGVAIGQTATYTANSLQTVSHRQKPDWLAIDRLVAEWKPSTLLVGLPLGPDGEETDMSKAARVLEPLCTNATHSTRITQMKDSVHGRHKSASLNAGQAVNCGARILLNWTPWLPRLSWKTGWGLCMAETCNG